MIILLLLVPFENAGLKVVVASQVLALAEWVWTSFHPGEQITTTLRMLEATRILHECDKDTSGSISQLEFFEYFEKTTTDVFR